MSDVDVEVTDEPDRGRYEARVDGELAGFAEYQVRGGRRIFTHTEVHDRYEGQGVGSRLAAGALDLARASGEPVVAKCPFIASYIERHPEYGDLLARSPAEAAGGS
jgi:predicted GNAT family acetyltransferase